MMGAVAVAHSLAAESGSNKEHKQKRRRSKINPLVDTTFHNINSATVAILTGGGPNDGGGGGGAVPGGGGGGGPPFGGGTEEIPGGGPDGGAGIFVISGR